MYTLDWVSFTVGFIVALFAAMLVSDLVFPNDKWKWEDEEENV